MITISEVAVNLVGPLHRQGGFGEHVRGFAATLANLMPIAAVAVGAKERFERLPAQLLQALQRPAAVDRPTIWIGPIVPATGLPGGYKIGWVTWETTKIPSAYCEMLAGFDELWLPSTFCRDLIVSALGDGRPIQVVPEGVDAQFYRPVSRSLSRDGRPFRFLSVGKWERRKGHDICLSAFLSAFRDDDDVELLLRLTPSAKDGSDLAHEAAALLAGASDSLRAKVRALAAVPSAGMRRLYSYADAFVLMTRSEAWGLPIIEAMSMGLPCIVTQYGGHLDFCTPENAFLCRSLGLVPASDAVYFPPSSDWGSWAEPDVSHLALLMRQVYSDRAKAAEVGRKARRDVVARWTWMHSARKAAGLIADRTLSSRG